MTREDRVRRGDMAAVLAENETFRFVLATIENEALTAIRNSLGSETDKREEQFFRLKSVDSVRDTIHKLIDDGRLAGKEIHDAQQADTARKEGRLAAGDVP